LKVSVVENNNQRTSSIFEPGFIAIYEENGEEWKVLKRFENRVCIARGIAAVRAAVSDAIKQLDDVKIVIAGEISGIAFGSFQAAGFEIFLVENSTLDVLDSVKKEMIELNEERKEKSGEFDIMKFLKPDEINGDFSLNMEEILLKNPEMTSKKILIPYLKKGELNRLESFSVIFLSGLTQI
jgi:Fe-only nitrogenase accessory protein AnfO